MASTNLFRAVSRGPSNPPERPTPPPALSPLKISTFLKSTRVASYLRPLVSRTLSPGVRHTVTTWRRSELARPVSQLPSIPRQRLTPHRDTLEKDLYGTPQMFLATPVLVNFPFDTSFGCAPRPLPAVAAAACIDGRSITSGAARMVTAAAAAPQALRAGAWSRPRV
jgi:hypothetical protein